MVIVFNNTSFKQVMTASGDGTAHVWQAAVLPESLGGEHQIMLSNILYVLIRAKVNFGWLGMGLRICMFPCMHCGTDTV